MFITGDTLDDILIKIYKKLLPKKSNINPTKGKAIELTGILLEIKNPRARLSRTEGKGKVFSALGELLWYMSGTHELNFIRYYIPKYDDFSDDNETVYGGYGPRIFGDYNQFNRVIEILNNKKDSRQAVIQIFDAEDLEERHKDIPCTCTLQFFLRNNKLSLIVNMRSNDAYLGLPHDVFAFTMIQEYAACILGYDIGHYKHFVGSLHLYDEHRNKARDYINEGWQDVIEMPIMPKENVINDFNIVKEFEKKIRTEEYSDINIINVNIDNYWKDLILMLIYFKEKRNNRNSTTTMDIIDRIHNDIYKTYIKKKEEISKSIKTSSYDNKDYIFTIKTLIEYLDDENLRQSGIISYASPIPAFGSLSRAKIATLGLNPSNNEFLDLNGKELDGQQRRFHTLNSLSLNKWSNIDNKSLNLIAESCNDYFKNNPYDRWFKPLDNLISGSGFSYYGDKSNSCHLDLVPFATHKKWSYLSNHE
ncbi:thymidylate synthase, partial [Salmonella enterica subsp. enterica]|nr:thymidylate synthase [Salmonella enterica subsp. enterica serovar Corvallis]